MKKTGKIMKIIPFGLLSLLGGGLLEQVGGSTTTTDSRLLEAIKQTGLKHSTTKKP